jgi:hypothetical protein
MCILKRFNIVDAIVIIMLLVSALHVYDWFYVTPNMEPKLKLSETVDTRPIDDTGMKMRILAETIWCENRTSRKSMDLVMSVIYNRAKEKTLNGLYDEATKSKQFSCLNSKDIMTSQKVGQKDREMFAWANQIVWRFMMGNFKPSIPAKFYYAPAKVEKPKYLTDKPLLLAYEGHNFH